jgi:uncharacterized membrane protein
MNYKSVDILVIIVITIVAVALVFVVPPDSVPGRILTLPLVLVLPGYALMASVFPRRSLGAVECLVFSLGLSLVIVVLGGLVLNWTPFGLRASSWSLLLGSITLGACAVALARRRGLRTCHAERMRSISALFRTYHAESMRSISALYGLLRIKGVGLTFRQGLLLGMAVVIICGAIAISNIGAAQQPFPGFTQLWILPAGGANPKNAVRLGVSNMESTAMEYSLAVNVDGKVVKLWPSIDLKPSEKWETTLMLPQTAHIGAVRVEVVLYRTNAPATIYRHVVLWLGT